VLVSGLVALAAGGDVVHNYAYLVWPITTLSFYLLLLSSPDDHHEWLIGLLVGFAAIEAVLGMSQSLFRWPVFTFASPDIFESDRGLLAYVLSGVSAHVGNGSGTFQHFNALGGLLALTLPISFGWLISQRHSPARILVFGLIAAGLLMTYSRGGWLGAAVGCGAAYWLSRPNSLRPLVPFVLAGLLAVGAAMTSYISAYYTATENMSIRVATWRFAMHHWLQHSETAPFGAGFGAFQQTVLAREISAGAYMMPALHSSLLQLLLELGVAGMLIFLWFVVTTIRPYVLERHQGWQAWVIGGMVAFLVSQAFDNAMFLMIGTCMFALTACLRRPDARGGPPA
jgi:hypothetical protein